MGKGSTRPFFPKTNNDKTGISPSLFQLYFKIEQNKHVVRENVNKHYSVFLFIMENNIEQYRYADPIEPEPINLEIQEEIRRVDAICFDHNSTEFTFDGQTGTMHNIRVRRHFYRTEELKQLTIEFYKQHPEKLKELENIDFVTLDDYRNNPNYRSRYLWNNLQVAQNHFYKRQMVLKDEFQHLFSEYVLK